MQNLIRTNVEIAQEKRAGITFETINSEGKNTQNAIFCTIRETSSRQAIPTRMRAGSHTLHRAPIDRIELRTSMDTIASVAAHIPEHSKVKPISRDSLFA